MTTNLLHEKLNNDVTAAQAYVFNPGVNRTIKLKLAKEVDELGRTPLAVLAGKAQRHTHALAGFAVELLCLYLQALSILNNDGETPIDIARGSGACAEIIGLLSLTPEEARLLEFKGMARLYAPVTYWRNEMALWIRSRSYADCHKFMNEHDDELVREVLKHDNSDLFIQISQQSQKYTESLVFLALRMIHRHPLSLAAISFQGGLSPLKMAEHPQFNACNEIRNVLRLNPKYISSTPFPTLLLKSLPTKYHEIYGTYNTVCTFIKHMKYDKAELVEVEDVLKPTHKCDVCCSLGAKPCARCKLTFYCSAECQKSAWKKHKKTCKAPKIPPATEAELRTLHKGIALLNMCIQRPGAGDGPTSVVLGFLVGF